MSKPYLLSFGGAVAYLQKLYRQIGIRDLLWLTAVVALWFAWGVDRDVESQNRERRARQQLLDLTAQVQKLEKKNAELDRALTRCLQSGDADGQDPD